MSEHNRKYNPRYWRRKKKVHEPEKIFSITIDVLWLFVGALAFVGGYVFTKKLKK